MRTSDTINELAGALAKAQGEIANPKKDGSNPHFKSRYATLAQVRDTVTPALAANGIALVQMTGPGEPGQMVLYTRLVHASGQWMESAYPVFMDTTKPQLMGSAMTYARRYAMSAICNIAQEDDDAQSVQDSTKSNGNDFVPMLDPTPTGKGNREISYAKTTGTTPGAVRAQGNSKYFSEMKTAMQAIGNLRDLRDWWDMHERELSEKCDPVGYKLLESDKVERENDFAARIPVK